MRVKSSFAKKAMAVAVVMSIIFSVGIMQVFATENTAQASQKEVHGSIAPINEEYLEYIKNGKGLKGHIPSMLDLSYLGERYAESAVSLYSNLPEKYDLREEGLVGAVPDQGMYGTCWTFGVLGSAESALMKKQFTCVDFSKKHLAWFAAYGNEEKEYCGQSYRYYEETEAPYMMGGDNGRALAALAAWKGPIYSSRLPYNNFDVKPDESLRYDADFHVQDCVYMYTTTSLNISPLPDAPDTELVKQFIMENGAYEISYLADSEHYDEGNFATYHDEKAAADHSNLIVGWDDKFPKENFKSGCQPENDGAWLVRNSWGTSWGDSGYFWLSYEDKTIEMWGASFTVESKDNYVNNYQYDTMGWGVSTAADDFIDVEDASKTAYISNIFTSGEEDEQLEAVSFYTTDVGTEYEIYVYTGVADGEPESGTLVCDGQEGAEDYCGYHTIELEKPVALAANTKFSVVVKLTNPEYAYPIATEAVFLDDGDAKPTYLGNGGESYYSIDGEDWTDIVELGKYASNRIEASEFSLYTTNVCLKAFTNPLPTSGAAISNVVFSLFDGEVEHGSELELSCAGADEIYYTVTPVDGNESEAIKYNEYQGITITEPCTVTAWGVRDGEIGNKVSRTFTKQTSQLTELILKYCSDGTVIQIDLNNAGSESVLENIDQNIQLKACGKDTITINDEEISSNEWSDEISLTEGVTNNITIKTEGEGKDPSTYNLRFYLSPLEYNYTDETVSFDENVYTVTDESGDELTSGASVSQYATVTGDADPKYLTVKNKNTGATKKLAVGQRPNLSCGIDYYNETTNVSFAANTYTSFNADMSDAKDISYKACELIPGKTVYIKRNATNYKFASNVYPIMAPKRPEAPKANIVEDGVGADNIVVSEIENGEYRIKPQNGSDDEWSEWQDENCFVELEPETEYTVEARVAATDESFASESASISVKTLAGVRVKIKYEAFNHTVWELEVLCAEGETVLKPDVENMEEWGYTVSDDDKANGKTVMVENKDGVLTPDKDEVVFEVTADVIPSNYSYTVNYWDEYGKLIKTSSFNFTYTEEVELSEIKIPAGYVLDGLVNPSQRFIAQLVYDNDKKKWIIQAKEINLKVKLKENGSSDTTFRIVHTNDIHGYYTATGKGAIGFAKLKTLSDFVDAELILDAGDTYHGQAFATVEKGLGIAELMKEVGYDAMTVGNHDWSYGAERLKELEKAQGFPILAANVTDKEGNAYFDTPYLTKTVTADDGKTLKVGIVGVIDSSFYDHTASENVKDVSFKAQAAAASETAKTLKAEDGEDCDIVIALAHIADCEDFVSELSDVDVVIAGHQHLLIDTSYTFISV